MKIKLYTLYLMLLSGFCLAQPSDNPYKSKYPQQQNKSHWTDSIPWSNVYSVTSYGAIANDDLDDYNSIKNAIADINTKGGGILFFPTGIYNSSEIIKIKNGVVLRGEADPNKTALETDYAPLSRIEFPRFVFDTTLNGGNGSDKTKAFKGIEGESVCSNAGVIDLDIFRGFVTFQPEYNLAPVGFTTPQPKILNRNIIVMGCRINYALRLDPGVPDTRTISGTDLRKRQRNWQVFPWRFSCNIDVMVSRNAVLAFNRCNDESFENFDMPNYRILKRNTTTWLTLGQRTVGTGWKANFDYNAHYGISVNRSKIYTNVNGAISVGGVVTYARPNEEPTLYAKGIEILNNWVFKTSRVGIIAAGLGLVMKGNVIDDDARKPQPAFENFLGPTGSVTPQGQTTLENRGIDFSGMDVTVEGNSLIAYRNYVEGYLTTDGEGILLQECCGGTPVNDYKIIFNDCPKGNYIGLYKMRDINNVFVKGNNMHNGPINMTANTNGSAYFLNNIHLDSNVNVSGINLSGSKGGVGASVTRNKGSNKITVPCHVVVNNNTGFSGVQYIANNGSTTPLIATGPCIPSSEYPVIDIISPSQNIILNWNGTPQNFSFKVKMSQGARDSVKIDFVVNSVVVQSNLKLGTDSTVSYTLNMTMPNRYAVYAVVKWGSVTAYSTVKTIDVVTDLKDPLSNDAQSFKLFPNPAQQFVNLANLKPGSWIEITDLSGKVLLNSRTELETEQLDVSQFVSGMYCVKVMNGNKIEYQRMMIK